MCPSQLMFFFLSVLFYCLLVCKFSAEKSSENLLSIPCNKLLFSYPFEDSPFVFVFDYSASHVGLFELSTWISLNLLHVYTYSCCSSSLGNLAIIYSNTPVFSLSCLSGTPMIIYWSTWWRPINSLSLFTFLHFFFPFLPLRIDNFKFLYVWSFFFIYLFECALEPF